MPPTTSPRAPHDSEADGDGHAAQLVAGARVSETFSENRLVYQDYGAARRAEVQAWLAKQASAGEAHRIAAAYAANPAAFYDHARHGGRPVEQDIAFRHVGPLGRLPRRPSAT